MTYEAGTDKSLTVADHYEVETVQDERGRWRCECPLPRCPHVVRTMTKYALGYELARHLNEKHEGGRGH